MTIISHEDEKYPTSIGGWRQGPCVQRRVALRPLTAFGQPLRQKPDLAPPGDLKPAAPPTFLPKS